MVPRRPMNILRALTWVALFSGVLGSVSPAQPAPNVDAFRTWARANAQPIGTAIPGKDTRDLAGLRAVVGTVRVVGVGESIHGIKEFLGLRRWLTGWRHSGCSISRSLLARTTSGPIESPKISVTAMPCSRITKPETE